jgi:capsular exopolysaccharide synthesis family protein
MSRVDEALRISEGASGQGRNTTPVHDPSALERYPGEGTRRPMQDTGTLRPVDVRRHVPSAPVHAPAKPAPPVENRLRLPLDDDAQARLVTGTSSTVSIEQYRRLAAALHDEQTEAHVSTVMVTSALPNEGKSLTAVNLALTLSESYKRRVLLIDADLRSPSVHTILDIANDRGLCEALFGEIGDAPITQVSERLSVLTAGRSGSNPLAGLTSRRMEEIVRDAAARFDWILIDTSPVGVLPDAQVLARLVHGVILVIAAGSTPAAAVERAVAELGGPDSIIGTVLNRVEKHRIPDAAYYAKY